MLKKVKKYHVSVEKKATTPTRIGEPNHFPEKGNGEGPVLRSMSSYDRE